MLFRHLSMVGKSLPKLRAELRRRRDELKRDAAKHIVTLGILALYWVVWEFLSPSSPLFYVAIIWITVGLLLFLQNYLLTAASALSMLVVFVVIYCLSASYYVASDQSRFRYGSSGEASYLEFPAQLSFLTSFLESFAAGKIINVISCGGAKVAKLPSLPFKPLFATKDHFYTPYGFRRFPGLRYGGIALTLETATGRASVPNSENKSMFSIAFGFVDNSDGVIPLTTIFARSETCTEESVPLLPILETLPWTPDGIGSLIKAVGKIDYLRSVYPDKAVSLDTLHQLSMDESDGAYKSLMDFLVNSIMYQMFSGNVLSELRAHIRNKLCVIVNNNRSAFSGPFSSLPENLMYQIASDVGDRYQLVYPACRVPNDIAQEARSANLQIPWMATFKKCLDTATSVRECLAQDDISKREEQCENDKCTQSGGRRISQQKLFQIYDDQFSRVVATRDNKLVGIDSIQPSECPQLRDKEEQGQLINQREAAASKITSEPFKCSSPEWQRRYARSQEAFKSALHCRTQSGLPNRMTPKDADWLFEFQYLLRCNGSVNLNNVSLTEDDFDFLDKLDDFIVKLRRYSHLIESRRIEAVINAIQLLGTIRDAVCEGRKMKSCVEKYSKFENRQALIEKVGPIMDLSFISGADIGEILNNLAKIDNLLINIGLCDLLASDEIANRMGRNREEFCDAHGLRSYRLVGPNKIGQLMMRPVDDAEKEKSYFYETHGADSSYGIRLPF